MIPEIVPSAASTATPTYNPPPHYTAHVRILCDTNLDDESRLQQCIKISQPFIDLIVAFIAIPLLVMFGLLLQASLQDTITTATTSITSEVFDTEIIDENNNSINKNISDNNILSDEIIISDRISTKNFEQWDENLRTRWTRVGLGIAMLSVCLILLGYISQRLGMCFWKKQPRIIHRYEERYPGDDSDNESTAGCSTQLYREDPPSYDLVVNCYDIPPPAYNTIKISEEDYPKIHSQK
ncbi:uncharacterized protein LOC123300469 [Chrysoperla carnea]|uniref:uncharacterized protein LOC123300469 n=1 Tax=Chrysoperla carnea TaxID=189513 RepID=UPI001D097311|nr:uncharacterized protein LOC123300469 [Chrysoperla carnea]